MSVLAHWEGWADGVWLGWEEEEEEPVVTPTPAVSATFYDVQLVGVDHKRKRKRLISRLLLLG